MEGRFFEVDNNMHTLRGQLERLPDALVAEFNERFEISWIYHDSALEGVVLSYSEIKAAVDKHIISDTSLIPSYQEIKQFKAAIDWTRELAASRKKPINVETIRKIYGILAPEEGAKGSPYRKDNPLHRLYYHDISPPEKITYRMRKLSEWFDDDATKRMHAVEYAARTHFKLMSIFPWTKHTGRVGRLLSNLILMREGYIPAILHSIDRQRYYEALRAEGKGIVNLYLESMGTSVETALKFFEEAQTAARKRAS